MSLSEDGRPRGAAETGDNTKPAGKNLVTVGGTSQELDSANFKNVVRELIGGRKRSAAGRDRIKPWQNPQVDAPDVTEDFANGGGLPRSYEEKEFEGITSNPDTRTLSTPKRLLDEQTLGLADVDDDKENLKLLKFERQQKRVADTEEIETSVEEEDNKDA